MFFDELSNDEWARLSTLVSDEPAVRLNRRGRPRAEPRIVANAVLWILTTGEPWSKLPGRYPSGPTCRRRFEEWQANGTLIEMVRLLSETGRTFAYVPEPTPPVATKPPPEVEPPKPRDDMVRGVFWKSPESWQTSAGTTGVTNGWRPLGPMADITRQLAGSMDTAEAVVAREVVPAHVDPRADTTHTDQDQHAHHAGSVEAREPQPASEAQHELHDDAHDAHDGPHSPLWMNLATPGGAQFADERGYVIYVMAEQVCSTMYRAWAEIMKDGRRVERSGLIGPRFDDADAARHYALEWSLEWIDRECGVPDEMTGDGAVVAEHAAATGSTAAAVAKPQPQPQPPVTRPMPDSAAAKNAVATANRTGTTVQASAVSASYPQHANSHRLQLRRYPSDGAADKTADRFPPIRKLFSHAR